MNVLDRNITTLLATLNTAVVTDETMALEEALHTFQQYRHRLAHKDTLQMLKDTADRLERKANECRIHGRYLLMDEYQDACNKADAAYEAALHA